MFYGDIQCERRKRILAELGKSFDIRIEHDLFGEEMLEAIRQSKVVVNIHYYEEAMLETTRLSEILSLGTSIIVSEKSTDPYEEKKLDGIVDFVEVDDINKMKDRISYWIEHSEERIAKVLENNNFIPLQLGEAKGLLETFIRKKVSD